jgi:hypothetical protein
MGRAYLVAHLSGGRAASHECELFKYNISSHLDVFQEYVMYSSVAPVAPSQADMPLFENLSFDSASTVGTTP